jgi:hypothetical protein
LDCAADQLLGVSFFELLSGLKIADRLGLGWYDDVMGAMTDAMKGIDDLGSLHSLLKSATDTGIDASRTAAQRFPGIFDKVKDAFNAADRDVLQSKFDRHAMDFGIAGNRNNETLAQFRDALGNHVQNPNTETVVGRYTRLQGDDRVFHHYNPDTGLNVMQRPNGDFISGWGLGRVDNLGVVSDT